MHYKDKSSELKKAKEYLFKAAMLRMKSYLNNLESDLKCINHRFNQYDESFKE
jgi:hypothetical protein